MQALPKSRHMSIIFLFLSECKPEGMLLNAERATGKGVEVKETINKQSQRVTKIFT